MGLTATGQQSLAPSFSVQRKESRKQSSHGTRKTAAAFHGIVPGETPFHRSHYDLKLFVTLVMYTGGTRPDPLLWDESAASERIRRTLRCRNWIKWIASPIRSFSPSAIAFISEIYGIVIDRHRSMLFCAREIYFVQLAVASAHQIFFV